MRIILNNGRVFWAFVAMLRFQSATRNTSATPKPAPVLNCGDVADRTP